MCGILKKDIISSTGYFKMKFSADLAQYNPKIILKLPVPTSSSIEITKYVKLALKRVYKEGFQYKKSGVKLMDISPEGDMQMNVFDPMTLERRKKEDSLFTPVEEWKIKNLFLFSHRIQASKCFLFCCNDILFLFQNPFFDLLYIVNPHQYLFLEINCTSSEMDRYYHE